MNKKNLFVSPSYIYIALPFLIFVLGWVKWYISIPAALFILYALYRMLKKDCDLWLPAWNKDTIRLGLLIVIVIGIWIYFSGVGGMAYQNTDHRWRNQIFQMLVNYDWPLVKDVTIDNVTETRGMIYYIGFWLPAALVGKLLGLRAGYLFQMVWALLGITLIYYYICAFFKKLSIYPLLAFIFFSGLDIIGVYMRNNDMSGLTNHEHIDFWCGIAQYSSMSTLLFWVFNQAIYAWLILCIIFAQKDNRHIVFIWSLAMINATFPFVGMIPFVIYKMIKNNRQKSVSFKERIPLFFKGVCTIENIFAGGFVGIISFIYLIGNISAQKVNPTLSSQVYSTTGFLFLASFFFLVEAGFYLFVMYPYQKNNILYYIVIIILVICPYIRVGSGADFCMRASIPALFVMYLLFIDTFSKSIHDKKWGIAVGLSILFLIGCATPYREFCRTVIRTSDMYINNSNFPVDPVSEIEIIGADNFSGNIEGNFFYHYLAK